MKKTYIVIALGLLMGTISASAGFRLTKSIYRVQNLQAAQDEARAKNRAICLLYTDADSKCGLATQAALDVIDAMDSKTVVVYVNSNNEGGFIPSFVQEALKSPDSGQFIPKTIVVDADLKEIIAMIPYASEQERKARCTKAKMAISAWQKAKEQASIGIAQPTGGAAAPAMRTWTSASGKTLEGQFSQLQQDMVVLTKPDGTTLQIHISKLCPGDQVLARHLSAAPRTP
ncbi:MAG TPA: hypothetical protein DCZ95_14395 [Verrucomicrobia bacterium]|nr:MAG: hypothetical protein A2X46_07180 [Lentisphaerae bacterium GWF2_57_35]HBA85274.1 hypothetical protein [Verrucomicrobiota bacterium]